ncbi:unnamed protein product [Lactuca virosa]|uniref:Uncharacterized protein n=1 Tax=Lactuca virosa TaxID=75947 RepID=A0AAU9LI26_9ASTR|nr:unnamed protein product [Lactuca virosa]
MLQRYYSLDVSEEDEESMEIVTQGLFHLKLVGLKGESINMTSSTGVSSVDWVELSVLEQNHLPLTSIDVNIKLIRNFLCYSCRKFLVSPLPEEIS